MNKNSARKCCGGKAYNRGYSTEPELIDLKPYTVDATLRYEQNQKLSEKFRVTCKEIEAKVNKRRRQAVLTPLFKLLAHLDASDPDNADIISNIKNQLAVLAKDPSKVELSSGSEAATSGKTPGSDPSVNNASEQPPQQSRMKVFSRHPSAFRLASAQNSPSTISHAPSTPRILSRGDSPRSITIEDDSELDGVRGSSCDEIFNYVLGMIKSIIPKHTRDEIEELEYSSAEPVATHNHSAHQRCGPSCWAYDALELTRTHNYLTESSPRSARSSLQPSSQQLTPASPNEQAPTATMTLPTTNYVTTSMRIPLEYAQY